MGPDTIITHGTNIHIMRGHGHGDSMFITILGQDGLLAQAGDNRMAGWHTNQNSIMQDGGDQPTNIRFTVRSKNLYIVKDTILYITKQ